MRAVQGARYDPRRPYICLEEDKVWDFDRTTWRLFGVVIWQRDTNRRDVPMHEFIGDCLGTR